MKKKVLVCHYAEIALKGKNRRFFEKRLLENIKDLLCDPKTFLLRGRIIVETEEKNPEEKLKKIPGISYFFFAEKTPSSLEKIKERVIALVKSKDFETFRITVKKADKSFPHSSFQIASIVGEEVCKETKKRVDLTNPDLNCFLEITPEETYVYFKKIKGPGGLPVGSGGKAVSLLSGGIDSPVASFRIMKRGVKNIFIHFHAYPATSWDSVEKAKKIVKKLSLSQGKSALYLVPFGEVQKEIMLETSERLRVLLYRRFMVKIACKIAKKERAKGVVTGESLGQVASQTIENMGAIGEASDIPLLRPLVGHNKEEIVEEAKGLGTYETSILPEEDCCVRFLPKNPETKGEVVVLQKEEGKLQAEKIIEDTLQKTKKEIIDIH